MDIGSEGMNCRGPARFMGAMAIPAGTVGDTECGIANPITATKLQHQYEKHGGQAQGATIVTRTEAAHVAYAAGTVVGLQAMMTGVANAGAATVTVDVKKNGTSILSALASFGTDAIRTLKTGTVSTPTYSAGDLLEIVTTATAGGGTVGQGLAWSLILRESAGP
jgi:hypothetical protein